MDNQAIFEDEDRREGWLGALWWILGWTCSFLAFCSRYHKDDSTYIWISQVDMLYPHRSYFYMVVILWVALLDGSCYSILSYCKARSTRLHEIVRMCLVPVISLLAALVFRENYRWFLFFVLGSASGLFFSLWSAVPEDVRVMELLICVASAFLSYHHKLLYSIFLVAYLAVLCYITIAKMKNDLVAIQDPTTAAAQDGPPRERDITQGPEEGNITEVKQDGSGCLSTYHHDTQYACSEGGDDLEDEDEDEDEEIVENGTRWTFI